MFRLALDALGGPYEMADIVVSVGHEGLKSLPARWKPYLEDRISLQWVNSGAFGEAEGLAQGDARWNYEYGAYDFVILGDADTLLLRPIDDLLAEMRRMPAAVGTIAHYPFPCRPDEDPQEKWLDLAHWFIGRPVEFDHTYTLAVEENGTSRRCPFYLNFGFVLLSPSIIHAIRSTFLAIRPQVALQLVAPVFSGQIALTLALVAHGIPTHAVGLRYNFPNDRYADRWHGNELSDVRLIHYLRTDHFNRQEIFATEDGFGRFLSLDLGGSDRVFQSYIRMLTGGVYPFS